MITRKPIVKEPMVLVEENHAGTYYYLIKDDSDLRRTALKIFAERQSMPRMYDYGTELDDLREDEGEEEFEFRLLQLRLARDGVGYAAWDYLEFRSNLGSESERVSLKHFEE